MIQSVSKFFPSWFFYDETAHIENVSNKIIEASSKIWISNSSLKKELESLSGTQLKKVVKTISEREECFDAFKTLAAILSPKQLEDCLDDNPQNLIKNLLHEARIFLQQTKPTEFPRISDYVSRTIDSMCNVLESVLDAFGIAEFFYPMENRLDRRPPVQMVITLLQFFSLLSAITLQFIAAGEVKIIIGSILLSICVLSLIYPKIKRFPSILPRAENWTNLYRFGKLPIHGSRNAAVEEIARTLIASKGIQRHPLLLGESGVGKTEAIKSLVEAIEQGKYPELKGKKVFYIDAANITKRLDSLRFLQYFSEKMGRHRDQIIVVINQVHLLCHKSFSPILGAQLASLLDRGESNFPYFIGITDKQNYKQHIEENNALTRWLKKIDIQSMKPAETAKVLTTEFVKHSPKVFLEPRIFETIVKKTKEAFGKSLVEPLSSSRVLAIALERTGDKQKTARETQLERLRSNLDDKRFDFSQNPAEIESIEQQICKLKTELQLEKKEAQKFYQERDQLGKRKVAMYKTAVKTASLGSTKFNHLILLHQILIPAREELLRAKANRLGIKTVVDSDLIDEVIAQEIK